MIYRQHYVVLAMLVFLSVATLLLLAGCLAPEVKEASPVPPSTTVYITSIGKKEYHQADCPAQRRANIPITLEDAKSLGYTPCKACKAPD